MCLFSFFLYRARYWRTVKEMIATFTVNIIVTGLMMVPLWFTGIIESRFLKNKNLKKSIAFNIVIDLDH